MYQRHERDVNSRNADSGKGREVPEREFLDHRIEDGVISITAIDKQNRKQRNRMQESCSYGSVGERGGNEPLYPENYNLRRRKEKVKSHKSKA